MPSKRTYRTSNIIRAALDSRDAVASLDALRVKTSDLEPGQFNHVSMDMLPQLAFLCSGGMMMIKNNTDNTYNNNAKKANDEDVVDPLLALCGLVVLETWSKNVPSIADKVKVVQTADKKANSTSDNSDAASSDKKPHPSWILNFSNEINRPPSDSHDIIPLTESTASLYLRLLAQVVCGELEGKFAKNGYKLVPVATSSSSSDAASSTPSPSSVSQIIDLASAYRSLIQSLTDQNTKQASTAQYSSELKRFTLRRRFFTPILQVAADQGLPRLCLEVLSSVDEFRSSQGGLKSSMVKMMSGDLGAANENDNDNAELGEVNNNDNDDQDEEAEEENVNVVSDEKVEKDNKEKEPELPRESGQIRPRDEYEKGSRTCPKSTRAYLELKQQKAEKREAHRKKSTKHADQNQSESCELWECDFTMMIQALVNYNPNSSNSEENQNQNTAVFIREYLDRVFSALSVATPLVGAEFVTAIQKLQEKLNTTGKNNVLFKANCEAQIELPTPHQQVALNDNQPCSCSSCFAAIGGPNLELNREDALMLADAIKNKLILARIEYKMKDQPAEVREAALQKFADFEKLCRETLDPSSIVVDGANIGFYGLRAWYAEAKKEMLKRRGVPESEWEADELDVHSRRSRGIHTEVAPSFSQLDMAMRKAARYIRDREFIVVLHERHLREESIKSNMTNEDYLAEWKNSLAITTTSRASEENDSDTEVENIKVHCIASPSEVNDDWCWMFMALCFSARTYPSKQDMDSMMKPQKSPASLPSIPLPVVLLTNDLMRDHITGLLPGKEEAGWRFLRYRWLHQVKCIIAHFSNDYTTNIPTTDAILKFPSRYHTWPVRFSANDENVNDDSSENNKKNNFKYSWHIPYTDAVLKQGTAKVGLVPSKKALEEKSKATAALAAEKAKEKLDDTNTSNTNDDDAEVKEEKQREVRLPEQLLDMLSFAAQEANGRMLCIQF